MYLRDAISISKINAAFLTGQQINRIHVQQLLFTMFVCKPYNTQRLLLYHEPSNSSIDPYAKKEPDFSWDVPIDILKSILQGRIACIGKCRSKGFGALPNKHFATQKVFLYRRKHCLHHLCVLSVRKLKVEDLAGTANKKRSGSVSVRNAVTLFCCLYHR